MRKLLLSLSALCALAGCDTLEEVITGAPEEIPGIQQWRCISGVDWARVQIEGYFSAYEVIVRLSRPEREEVGIGEITVAGTTHTAIFAVEGVDLRWYFGQDSQYSFIVQPDGTARYYNFSGVEEGEKILPSQTYGCKAWK